MVYLVRHIGLNVLRVIKQIKKNLANISCYFVEINILKNVSIRGIPMIYDVEEDEENLYIVEEYVQGIKFSEYIIDSERTKEQLIGCIMDICDIITKLHELTPNPVIYNDLKPDNILINKDEIYLVDFGNCRISGLEYCNNMASVSNVTPEHLKVIEPDTQTDVYAIGVLIQNIYQSHKEMFEKDKDIINMIISGCLEKDIVDRIQNPKIIKKYFEEFVISEKYSNAQKSVFKERSLFKDISLFKERGLINQRDSFDEYLNEREMSLQLGVFNVYVYGCREYAGTTHFSIGFTKYLSELKKKSVYIETGKGRGFSEYLCNRDVDTVGIIKYDKCEIWPYYGNFIEKHENVFDGIQIYDCGVYQEENITEGIVIVVITDIKSFGRLRYELFGKNAIYVVNFSDELGFKRFDRSTDIKVVQMPYFSNPLKLDKDCKIFYKRVLELISGKSEK